MNFPKSTSLKGETALGCLLVGCFHSGISFSGLFRTSSRFGMGVGAGGVRELGVTVKETSVRKSHVIAPR